MMGWDGKGEAPESSSRSVSSPLWSKWDDDCRLWIVGSAGNFCSKCGVGCDHDATGENGMSLAVHYKTCFLPCRSGVHRDAC
jgi:hypothetical protein